MSEQTNCPNCGHPIGDPVRPGMPLHKKKAISSSDLMLCCRCFELMQGTDKGGLRILTSKERAFLLIHRGGEIIFMMRAAAMAAQADKEGAN